MHEFLLAQPDSVVRATGSRTTYSRAHRAAAALHDGTAEAIVGALAFDPRHPSALVAPEQFERTAGPWRPAALPPLPPIRIGAEIPSRDEHMARVRALVERLQDPTQPLDKVVAARSVVAEADSALTPEVMAAHLAARHPNASVFTVDLTAGGRTGASLVGATPEVLIARSGTTVTLRPLAGTAARHNEPEADRIAAEKLLVSGKNRAEHAFVIEWIRHQLTPLCAELVIPDEPQLMSTHEVWHLATPITGTLSDTSTTALDLAILLHPTPAVCGTPTEQALAVIAATEDDRGYYGGAVGWCDHTGDGAWVVAIRSAELSADGRTVRAYAGGGIVAASDPRAELDETTTKLRTLLGAVHCTVPAESR